LQAASNALWTAIGSLAGKLHSIAASRILSDKRPLRFIPRRLAGGRMDSRGELDVGIEDQRWPLVANAMSDSIY
jgi:hypothetical protein